MVDRYGLAEGQAEHRLEHTSLAALGLALRRLCEAIAAHQERIPSLSPIEETPGHDGGAITHSARIT